jgi:hypothetical protein
MGVIMGHGSGVESSWPRSEPCFAHWNVDPTFVDFQDFIPGESILDRNHIPRSNQYFGNSRSYSFYFTACNDLFKNCSEIMTRFFVIFFFYLVNFWCIHKLSSVLNVKIIINVRNMRVECCPVTVPQWRNQFLRSVWRFLLSLLSVCGSGRLFGMVVMSWVVWSWNVSNNVEYVFFNVSVTSGRCRSVFSVSFVIMGSILLFCN